MTIHTNDQNNNATAQILTRIASSISLEPENFYQWTKIIENMFSILDARLFRECKQKTCIFLSQIADEKMHYFYSNIDGRRK